MSREEWAGGVRASTSAVVLVGVAAAVLVVLAAVALPPDLRGPVAAFGVVIPGVLLQDHLRFAFFAAGRPVHAFVNDAVWAVMQFAGIAVLLVAGAPSVTVLVLVWGGSGTAAALVGLLQLRERPAPSRTMWWLRGQRDLWGLYTVENALLQVTNILVLAVVGYVGGLAAAGSLRAATVVFGPLIVLSLGAVAVGVPELARLRQRRPGAVRGAALGIGAGLAVTGAAWGVLASLLPPWVGETLLGPTWALASPILLLVTVDATATLFVLGPFIGLRALGSARRSLNARVVFGGARLAVACTGAFLGGVTGAVIGFAIVAPIQMIVWARVLSRAAASAGDPAQGRTHTQSA